MQNVCKRLPFNHKFVSFSRPSVNNHGQEKRMIDQARTGAFISTRRKDKGLTQVQLAERLGITDRAVSKWERGLCLPDASLMIPLCQILGISVNELLLGQYSEDGGSQQKLQLTNAMNRRMCLREMPFSNSVKLGTDNVKRLV